MRFSCALAIILGVCAPVMETVRRWHTWREYPPALFDDYIMGALLLWGAWLVLRGFSSGQRFLAAAWGFTCGLGYYSFFAQYRRFLLGEADPAPIPPSAVLILKGVGLLLAIAALVATLRAQKRLAGDGGPE